MEQAINEKNQGYNFKQRLQNLIQKKDIINQKAEHIVRFDYNDIMT